MTLDEMRAMVARGGAKVRGFGCGKDDCFLKSERNKFPGVGLDRTREKCDTDHTPDVKKPQKGGGRPRHKESTLQIACVKWFNAIYPEHQGLLFSVPNGGQRNAITAKIMKAEGVVAGVSDLILFMPRRRYHALCIEMKVDTNKYLRSRCPKKKNRTTIRPWAIMILVSTCPATVSRHSTC